MANRNGRKVYDLGKGYSVSVIDYGYGSDEGLYEVAVLYKGVVTSTPLIECDDVRGWMSMEDVFAFLGAAQTWVDSL